jgi:hypothetical protein
MARALELPSALRTAKGPERWVMVAAVAARATEVVLNMVSNIIFNSIILLISFMIYTPMKDFKGSYRT